MFGINDRFKIDESAGNDVVNFWKKPGRAGAHRAKRSPATTDSLKPAPPEPSNHGSMVSTNFVRQTSSEPPVQMAELVLEVLEAWDRFSRLAPDPDRSVQHLSERTRIPFFDIGHLREVRNLCAHPDESGWPSLPDIDQAFKTAGELRRRLGRRG
jgi:hypothetical protein